MNERGGRLFLALCVLVLVWIGVYWVWEPGGASADPVITFDDRPPESSAPTAAPEHQTEPSMPRQGHPTPETVPETAHTEAPGYRSYTVREGDTFERIAQRELGRQSLWTAIAQANPLKDPTRLRPGDLVRIPLDPTNIQGRPTSEAGPPTPEPTTVEYTVTNGDTLEGIAKAYYGSPGFAEFIYFNNRDSLRSKDDLKIGQVLRLLPPPDGG